MSSLNHQPASPRHVRRVAWVVLIAIGAFQAYAQRFTVGPDGVSYLDLSDAVAHGRWSDLLNLYWSPLLPALIGAVRGVLGTGPAIELPIVHGVLFVAFVLLCIAFEYFLAPVRAIARRVPGAPLGMRWGLAAAYALFGFFALTMTPLELTTPDLLVAAASFIAFGALLRLRETTIERPVLHSVLLGGSLGAGALAKSFMVPWGIVCLAVAAIVLLRHGRPRPLGIALMAWAVFVVPWTLALSRVAGHVTFGETGRLTYAWYVNEQQPPSLGGAAPGTRFAPTDEILIGTAVMGDAPGTDPMWYDPARWNADLRPHFRWNDQIGTLAEFGRFAVLNFTVVLFLAFFVIVAPRGTRRTAWFEGWVVYVPAIAGLAAYAMVLVAARYIMPFIAGGTLLLLASVPLARRISPGLGLLGLLVPIALESLDPATAAGLRLAMGLVGGMLVGVLVPARRRAVWVLAVILGQVVTMVVLPSLLGAMLPIGAVALAVLVWVVSRAAIREERAASFAMRAQASLALLIGLALAIRFEARAKSDVQALARAAMPSWGNASLTIARDLQAHGVAEGTRIAVIGPHTEAYWARAGRLKIVADVPRDLAPRFWRLSPAARDALLAQFAAAGATIAVASVPPERGAPDSTWVPVRYGGYVKPLVPSRQPRR
jgi:hypothetical protein